MKTKENRKYKVSQISTLSIFGFTSFIENYNLLKNMVVKDKKSKKYLIPLYFIYILIFPAGY